MNNPEKERVSIQGTILMLDDVTPHVAMPVQAISHGEVIATVLSDKRGKYQFVNLKPGQYQLRCQVPGVYIYYGEERNTATDGSSAAFLQIRPGITNSNIDFRFAPFKKGVWRNYTSLDGLANSFVYSMHVDSDGVMWFGTFGGGVCRYDGSTFVNFTVEDGLAGNNVCAICRDHNNTLWFGSIDGGVSCYDGRGMGDSPHFINFTTKDGLVANAVTAIYCDDDGILWFGTGYWDAKAAGVSRYDGKEFVNFSTKEGLAGDWVHAILRDPDGIVWFGTDKGVSRYDGRGMGDSPHFTNFTTEDGLLANNVWAVHRGPEGSMWFGTWNGGVSRYDGRGMGDSPHFTNFTTEDGLAGNIVYAIYHDPDGILWFGTDGGVSRYDGQTFINFTIEDGLVNRSVHNIHHDPNGVMWFTAGWAGNVGGGGVSRYDANTFINLTTKDGLAANNVSTIYHDPDGFLWFGTNGGGVSCYDGESFVNLSQVDGLVGDNIWSIHRDLHGVLWFGSRWDGFSRYDGKEFLNFTKADGLPSNQITAMHGNPDGTMWFATLWGGVFRYDGQDFVNLTTTDGLASNFVWAIQHDSDGVLWFGTGVGISRYEGGTFFNLTTEDGLVDNEVLAIHKSSDGALWVGTKNGVSRYDGKEFLNYTTKDGLVSNYVTAIHQSSDGAMWFGTEGSGVSRYDGAAWSSLDMRDGLAGNSVMAIYQDEDGYLWFGTEGGVTRYRMDTTPPKARVVSVTTDKTYHDIFAVPAFNPNTRVTIEYSSIDFKTIPEKRQYRCRIIEIDSDWRKPTRDTSTDFIFDKPGTYTFEVQAIDRDLNYSEPASVKLEVIPDPRNHRIIQLEEHIHQQELAELGRVHKELEDARQIQLSLLPDKSPEIDGFQIEGISRPAREVSGDFYNYLRLGDNIGIILGDVTGKSVKAAMVAVMSDGMLHSEVEERENIWNSPGKILTRLNTRLKPRLIKGMFTGMSLGVVQQKQKKLIFSNAGMPYPVVKRGHKAWELILNGLPLGITDMAEYEDLSLDFEEGDFVVFCSDGVIEAENESEEMYQTEKLLEVIQQSGQDMSAQDMVDLILKDVIAFVGDKEASDDITIVVVKREGLSY